MSAMSSNQDLNRYRFGSDTRTPTNKGTKRASTSSSTTSSIDSATRSGNSKSASSTHKLQKTKTTSRDIANPFTEGGTRCGKDFGNSCPDNQCCSQWGWCDVGPQYCGDGCQEGYGKCGSGGGGGGDDGGNGGNGGNGKKATVHTQCTEPGTVAITFDDGPAETTAGLLRLLKRYNLKVTFFVNGKNYLDPTSSTWKNAVRQAHDDGHIIASHTFEHINLSKASASEVRRQMTLNEEAIKAVIGKRPVFMRPPYGDVSDTALTVLGDMGYEVVNWDIETLDTEHHDADRSVAAYEKVLSSSDAQTDGHIALEHDPVESSATQLIPRVMPVLKKYGFRPVLIDECLGFQGSPYRD